MCKPIEKKYMFYVSDFTRPVNVNGKQQGFHQKKYWFNHFKIYWAYKHLIAEEIDAKGVIGQSIDYETKQFITTILKTFYRGKYIDNKHYELEYKKFLNNV